MNQTIDDLTIHGSHYCFDLKVNGLRAIIELKRGWWCSSDGIGNEIMPPFRRKDRIDAIAVVAKFLRSQT